MHYTILWVAVTPLVAPSVEDALCEEKELNYMSQIVIKAHMHTRRERERARERESWLNERAQLQRTNGTSNQSVLID